MSPKISITFCFIAWAMGMAWGDSIRVDGHTYREVYVRPGPSMYYIHNPADGSTQAVSKKKVSPSDVHYSEDPALRQALLAEWRANKRARGGGPPPSITYEEWRATLPKDTSPISSESSGVRPRAGVRKHGIQAKETSQGVLEITNRPRSRSRSGAQRTVFVNRQGVGVLTNTPEAFQGREDYIEVAIHYDPIEVPKRFRAPASPDKYAGAPLEDIIRYYAGYYRLDKNLVYAVIKAESNGDQFAVSKAGARGLMQLMPGTAAEMGVRKIFDPAENIAGGTQYLAKLMKLFKNNSTLALAAYNAGPGNVKKHGGVPPFPETQNYVRIVRQYQRKYRRDGPPNLPAPKRPTVSLAYLPPESREHYQIVLHNGLTIPAEGIVDNDPYYDYVFKGRKRRIKKSLIRAVYEPT